jgi:hypothetical protein
MTTIAVKDATGATQNLEVPLTTGQKTMALSRPVALASDQAAIPVSGFQLGAGAVTGTTTRVTIDTGQLGTLVAGGVPTVSGGFEYEAVAASTTAMLGTTGAIGDYIEGLICIVGTPATSLVQIKDGSGTAMDVLPNGVGAGVGTYYVPLGLLSTGVGWTVITLAGVKVIATGNFT